MRAVGTVLTTLPVPLDRAAVTEAALDAMRDAAHRCPQQRRGQPAWTAAARVSISSVGDVLPFKAQVLVSALSGPEAIADARCKYAGLEPVSGCIRGLTKRGRPLYQRPAAQPHGALPTRDNRLPAAGGNGLLPEKFLAAGRTVVAEDLRQLVLQRLVQQASRSAATRRYSWSGDRCGAALDFGADRLNVRRRVTPAASMIVRSSAAAVDRVPDRQHPARGDGPSDPSGTAHYGLFTAQSWLRTTATADMTAPDPAKPSAWIGPETADLINLLAL